MCRVPTAVEAVRGGDAAQGSAGVGAAVAMPLGIHADLAAENDIHWCNEPVGMSLIGLLARPAMMTKGESTRAWYAIRTHTAIASLYCYPSCRGHAPDLLDLFMRSEA